ncbi:hypothetical protein [Shimia abyssi]|uniref:Aminoglycoside phosphotransferase domain-containing protein n=1 Tax=Shimia abyssi TaxID=1662395 RepID=A0A2P8FB00_9RHOB|nr:hypothetical protein [Shimia abyssi]PSL18913.1 hypothetical protein CLV88_10891 [Shimia abyssi]
MKLGDLLSAATAAREIFQEVDARFGPGAGEVGDVLKAGREVRVFAGRFQGKAAVFKQLLTDDATQKLSDTEAELAFLAEALPGGAARAVPFLAALPQTKTLILGHAPGQKVSVALKTDNRSERSRVMARCGDWLAKVAPLRTEMRPFWGRKIARRAGEGDGRVPEGGEKLFQSTLDRMMAIGLRHRGQSKSHAKAHGDFAPVNLNIDQDTVWAFDIQGGHSLPLARMAARFLVAASMYRAGAPGPLGLDADDVMAFDVGQILPDDEQTELFAFFVAEQFLRRLKSEGRTGEGLKSALTRLEVLHDQLPEIRGNAG